MPPGPPSIVPLPPRHREQSSRVAQFADYLDSASTRGHRFRQFCALQPLEHAGTIHRARQFSFHKVGKAHPLPRSSRLQRVMQFVREISHLQHLRHASSIQTCAVHVHRSAQAIIAQYAHLGLVPPCCFLNSGSRLFPSRRAGYRPRSHGDRHPPTPGPL